MTDARYRGGVPSRHAQRGVALIVAILLVALGTIVAAAMAYSNAMTARRAAATFEFDQALLVAEGAEGLAAYGLQLSLQQNAGYVSPTQPWGNPVPPQNVPGMPGVTLEASLEDLQGRFNINDLVAGQNGAPNTVAIQIFQRLLTKLGIDPNLADNVVEWINSSPTPIVSDGAEDSTYLERSPPYRAAKTPITSTSELLAVQGFTRAIFDKLAPHIAALPIGSAATPINVCSADRVLLDALSDVQTAESEDQFEKDRKAEGGCFPPLNTVTVKGAGQTSANYIGQTSSWFRLTTFVNIGSAEFAVYTLLYVDHQKVRPIMRSFTPD